MMSFIFTDNYIFKTIAKILKKIILMVSPKGQSRFQNSLSFHLKRDSLKRQSQIKIYKYPYYM